MIHITIYQCPSLTIARFCLQVFYEEELDVPLVLFDEVLDHVLRIDRIFRQPQGHVLLIGVSGAGKTTLSRFVAWMNGLSTYQIKVHNKYTAMDFDEDLRTVLRRSGCKVRYCKCLQFCAWKVSSFDYLNYYIYSFEYSYIHIFVIKIILAH